MALSEQEQRLLDQLEAALAADDPKLASTLRGTTHRRVRPRRAGLAVAGFLVGLAGLVAGMQLHPVVSVLGFVVMLLSAVAGLGAWPRAERQHDRQPSAAHPSQQDPGSTAKLEERWRRQQDGH